MARLRSAKEHFECNRRFWDIIFTKAQGPILRELFRHLEDRGTRYEPLLQKLFPTETRPRQQEVLIEIYRKGRLARRFQPLERSF